MALFGSQINKSFLGVDIGTGGVKVVELLSEKGRARLLNYGYSRQVSENTSKMIIEDPKHAARLLTSVYQKMGTKTTSCVSALPASKVFSAIISVPRPKDEKELKPLVESRARKLVPMPLEEMILDSKLIDPLKKEENKKIKKQENKQGAPKKVEKGNVRVLITGAAKTLVQKYVETFRSAKLELTALETESFALIRSLVGKDRSSILIIDIGAIRTNLTIVEKGIPFLTRSVNIGGSMVTQKIAQTMGASFEQAEQMKYDLSQHDDGQGLAAVETTLQPILNEIKYTFEQYERMEFNDHKKVEKIVLTGGSSHLPQLDKYIGDKTKLNTYVGDPWARVVYPEDLRPVLEEIGPRMSVSLGLAMRDTE